MLFIKQPIKTLFFYCLLFSVIFANSGHTAAPSITGYNKPSLEGEAPGFRYFCENKNYKVKKKGNRYVCSSPGKPDKEVKMEKICPEAYKDPKGGTLQMSSTESSCKDVQEVSATP